MREQNEPWLEGYGSEPSDCHQFNILESKIISIPVCGTIDHVSWRMLQLAGERLHVFPVEPEASIRSWLEDRIA
jgi:hypothetical protein